jgi:CHAT domain-containing protein/tetratricopeptide (TPR) repeat protein
MRNTAVVAGLCLAIALFASVNLCPRAFLCAAQIPAAPQASLPALSPEAQQKLDQLRAAVHVAHASNNAAKEATAQLVLGDFSLLISEEKKALDAYNQALTLARSAKEQALEAAALNGIASCYRTEFAYDKALAEYQQALDKATAAGDEKGEAVALAGMGWVNGNVREFQKGLDLDNQALALAEKLKDSDLQAQILNRIGVINDDLGNNDKALDFYNQALGLWRAAGDEDGEGKALNNLGILASETGDPPKALSYYQQALPLYRKAGDRSGEAGVLNNLGILYRTTGEEQNALKTFWQALPLERALGNRSGEAAVLLNLGNVESDLGENTEALKSLNDALAIQRSLNELDGEAGALHNIAGVWVHLGEMQKALEALQQALTIWTNSGERRGQADTLNAIGVVYDDLGQPQQALEYYGRAFAFDKDLDDPSGAASVLNNIAGLYTAPGQAQQALQYHTMALQLERAVHARDAEARTLDNMGLVYESTGDKQKAQENYEQALQIWKDVGDRRGEALALDNLGSLLNDAGDTEKARAYYAQALPLATGVGDPIREAQIFHDLMLNHKAEHPALAIFYGKQAVNLLQQVRGQMQGLDQALQKSFLASKNEYYHDLASLLIAQGRLPEAQQVLDLLKDQEYSDYVRGETANILQPLTLTPAEQQAKDEYLKSTAQIVAIGEQWAQLRRNSARTAEQEKTFQQLSDQLDAASKGLSEYYAQLYVTFGSNNAANQQVADIKGNVSLLKQTIAKSPGAVALYTMTGKDRYSVIFITGSTAVAREYAIKEADLNRKVAEFKMALRDPRRDVKPLATDLYTILMGPVAADLEQAKAETLVWSLDGVLRYVPVAALYDGAHYVVEKYNTVTITPASIPHLTEKPDASNLSAAAMGISRQYEQSLPPLPSVAVELDDVVHDAQSKDAHGALPGTILLDGAFTEKAMENLLDRNFTVVHIASHFVFSPGDDSQSYLLLAGKDSDSAGYHLTVADFRDNQRLSLDETELLTLSACDTGMSGNASNGREIDGLGTTAQMKGAKAVISSLWEVNDASTGSLMADFYKRWAEGEGKVTKAEALRQAQLDLLQGRITPQSAASGRGVSAVETEPAAQSSPAGFAHPYYWAPFVLMGNWK